jgi:hypothetical protein
MKLLFEEWLDKIQEEEDYGFDRTDPYWKIIYERYLEK